MGSAFVGLKNATAVFVVPGTGVVTDPATGNVMPVQVQVAVDLWLKANRVTMAGYPGVEIVDTLYDGYCVDPAELDQRVGVGTKGTLEFGGEDGVECEVTAVRVPYGKTGVLGEVLEAALGTPVQLIARGQR